MNVYFVPLIALFVQTLQILLASRLENRADARTVNEKEEEKNNKLNRTINDYTKVGSVTK